MNRLEPAHGRRVVCIAAMWLLATMDVSAQIQMLAEPTPAPTSAMPPSASPASAAPTLASGQQLLAQVRSAIASEDYHTAVQSFRQASAISGTIPQLSGDVEKLRAQLQHIGIDAALLAMPAQPPAPAMQRLPDVAGAQPIASLASPANRKQETLRLVAIGRAALDRGDVATALKVARQAQALKVPEKDFAAGEPRVWDLLLEAESAARRSGIALTAGESATGNRFNAVQPAVGVSTDNEASVIAQMLFNADADAAPATAGDIRQVQNFEELPQSEASYAERMFYDGLDALVREIPQPHASDSKKRGSTRRTSILRSVANSRTS